MGYGYMWWVFLEPRFEPHGMVSASGVGNQMIAALPDSDLVIVNRADTFGDERTPMRPLLALIEEVLDARTGEVKADPELVPMEDGPADPRMTSVSDERLQELVGEWAYPPAVFGRPALATVEVSLRPGHVLSSTPGWGTFAHYLQPDGTLFEEDSRETYYLIHDAAGAFAGIADDSAVVEGALSAAAAGKGARADELLAMLPEPQGLLVDLARILIVALPGDFEDAVSALRDLAGRSAQGNVERRINGFGYGFLQADETEAALRLFELNTAIFPESFNAWDSLAEVHAALGNNEDALTFYELSLDINAENANALEQMARIREATAERE